MSNASALANADDTKGLIKESTRFHDAVEQANIPSSQ
jgi:hypothetical protein